MSSCRAIDIVVPIYKNATLTKRCIDSILENLEEIRLLSPRLVLINDSPDDREVNTMLEGIAAHNPSAIIMTNTVNCGFVQSVNRGLKLSVDEGRDVVLVNSDTETFKGTLANLVDAAYSDPQIGFVSPRSNNASICSLPHAFYSPSQPTPKETFDRWQEVGASLPKVHLTPTAIGFYLFIKHKILANVGFLREEFGVGYEEENDLIMRANRSGYRAALANRAFAFHAGSASFNLLDLDLNSHRNSNLQKMCKNFPEFLPLVRKYEWSPHFRAELMLSGLVGSKSGSIRVVIDLSGIGCHHNGTNELALGIVRSIGARQGIDLEVSLLCSMEEFKFHKLDMIEGVVRLDEGNPGKHAISIRLGQPFDQHHINVLEDMAPINIYGMLDTIAEDCGHLSISNNFEVYWHHVAKHANGLFFISKFSEQTFCFRYPEAQLRPKYTCLLPTKLSSYAPHPRKYSAQHVLVLGNHFPHKASDATATILCKSFPDVQFVVLGAESFQNGNLRGYRSGTLSPETVALLFSRASVVVLPSHVEGFGFGVMHALAAHKPIVARNIDATNEILASYSSVKGVSLYDNDTEIVEALSLAFGQDKSAVDDSTAIGWDQWVDGLIQFFIQLVNDKELFGTLRDRIAASDLNRKSNHQVERIRAENTIAFVENSAQVNTAASSMNLPAPPPAASEAAEVSGVSENDLKSLLQYDDGEFVENAYLAILDRPADPTGFNSYLSRLRDGIPKVKILSDIQNSAEGKKVGKELKGLREALVEQKRTEFPFIGAFFKLRR